MPLFKRACVVLFLISVSACSNSPSSPTSSVPVTVSPTLVITPPSVLERWSVGSVYRHGSKSTRRKYDSDPRRERRSRSDGDFCPRR